MIGFLCSGMIRPRTKSIISAGTSVTDSSAAAAIEKVLVKASGLNSRPSCASSVKIGRNDTVMISRLKNSAGPTSRAASIRISTRGLARARARSRCLWAFSIMTIAASTMAPIAIAMPPRLMMLEPSPSSFMAPNAISTPTGSIRIATSALRTCSRKTMQTSATMMLSSNSVCFSVSIARVDQVGAVVDRHDLDRLRQAAGDLGEALLDVVDDVERIRAEALQHDAARDLALAVQLGDAAPLVGAELDARHVAQQHRRAAVGLQHDVAEIVDALQIALAADDVFELGQLDGAAADIGVAGADRVAHLRQA